MAEDQGQTRLVFNPSDVPVLNEDTGKLIDGGGWTHIDTSGEWAQEAIDTGTIVLMPEDLSGVDDMNPEVAAALQKMEEEKAEGEAAPEEESAEEGEDGDQEPQESQGDQEEDSESPDSEQTGTTEE